MEVKTFDIEKGIYWFTVEELETDWHHHPAIEFVFAQKGCFHLEVETTRFENIRFAIIDRNISHRICSKSSELSLLMLEHHEKIIKKHLSHVSTPIENGYFVQETEKDTGLINEIFEVLKEINNSRGYDTRVEKIIDALDLQHLSYQITRSELNSLVNLSESRVSHLFSQNLGTTLKKYIVWSRLKKTIHTFIHQEGDLFDALVKHGFYDQAHFSKAFKSMMGLNVSKVYNSRFLQFSQEREK